MSKKDDSLYEILEMPGSSLEAKAEAFWNKRFRKMMADSGVPEDGLNSMVKNYVKSIVPLLKELPPKGGKKKASLKSLLSEEGLMGTVFDEGRSGN